MASASNVAHGPPRNLQQTSHKQSSTHSSKLHGLVQSIGHNLNSINETNKKI